MARASWNACSMSGAHTPSASLPISPSEFSEPCATRRERGRERGGGGEERKGEGRKREMRDRRRERERSKHPLATTTFALPRAAPCHTTHKRQTN